MATEQSNIENVSAAELAELMSMGSAENVITEEVVPSVLQRENTDANVTFGKEKETEEEKKARLEKENTPENIEAALQLEEVVSEETQEERVEKSQIYSALEELVKEEKFLLFEGDKELKDYTKKELIEVFQANEKRVREEEQEKAPAELFDSLPSQLQYAISYVANGGTDLQRVFKHLSQSEEVSNLDIETEKGQEDTIRTYLKMSGDMTPEEIEEEVNSIKDLPGALEKKAKLYKPKLESKQQQIIDKELKDQEFRKKQQEKAAIKYREDVISALKADDLDGLKLNSSVKGMLFDGLTQANYPSVSGRNTNLFGHLIEKYNYVEPNPKLIAEALWLLKDRKGYHESIKASVNAELVGETVKKLKTAGQEKVTNTTLETQHNTQIKKTIPKQKTNIFSRT